VAVDDAGGGGGPPDVASAAEQRADDGGEDRETDGEAVEGAAPVDFLPGFRGAGKDAGAQHEAQDTASRPVLGGQAQRPAGQRATALRGGQGFGQRPAVGQAEIDRQRIGLALGQKDESRPVVAEDVGAAREYVAHGAIAAVHHEVVDTAPRELGERVVQVLAGPRGLGQDVGAVRHLGREALVAMAARIAHNADERHRATTTGRAY